jgi:lipopolysaccharide transport system ATP-binding protein
MSDIAIRAEELSKRYRIGELQQYKALRDTLTDTLYAPFRLVISMLNGRHAENSMQRSANGFIWALHDLSFEVKRGEVVGVIGRNGVGKSTLLKLLSRITEPTSGYADIHGRVGSLLEVGTGFHPELTGRENIYLNGAIMGMKTTEIRRQFDEIVTFAEVEQFIDTPVKHYSSGMYMRLAFAVAAHLEPEILLVDEVLAVGDISFQKKCLGKMENVVQTGRTVIFVSHNMAAVRQLCKRTILISNGHLLADGDTEDIIQAYVSSGIVDKPDYSQPPDEDKALHLRRMLIVDDKGCCQPELHYDKPFKIIIEYDVNTPVRGCGVAFSIRTLDEIRVFTTADYDAEPKMLDLRQPGSYRTDVTIPGQWLNPNQYKVVVFLTQSTGTVYDSTETLAFRILDTGTPSQRLGTSGRKGVLQPILPWHTICSDHRSD